MWSTSHMLCERPPEPWHSFFLDIDQVLVQPVELQCIGGFAIAMLYGLPRPTVDVDYLSVTPIEANAKLESLAGMGSAYSHSTPSAAGAQASTPKRLRSAAACNAMGLPESATARRCQARIPKVWPLRNQLS